MAEVILIMFVLGILVGLWFSRVIGAARDLVGR